MQMEDVLTLLGLAGGIYWLVNNRTKTSTRETITERKTILTDSGSITYERQREIDSKQMAIMREGVRQFEKSKNAPPRQYRAPASDNQPRHGHPSHRYRQHKGQ